MANTPMADPTPTPALVPAERPDFEPRLLVVGEFLADEPAAVPDRFEDDVDVITDATEGTMDEDAVFGATVDVEREMTFLF